MIKIHLSLRWISLCLTVNLAWWKGKFAVTSTMYLWRIPPRQHRWIMDEPFTWLGLTDAVDFTTGHRWMVAGNSTAVFSHCVNEPVFVLESSFASFGLYHCLYPSGHALNYVSTNLLRCSFYFICNCFQSSCRPAGGTPFTLRYCLMLWHRFSIELGSGGCAVYFRTLTVSCWNQCQVFWKVWCGHWAVERWALTAQPMVARNSTWRMLVVSSASILPSIMHIWLASWGDLQPLTTTDLPTKLGRPTDILSFGADCNIIVCSCLFHLVLTVSKYNQIPVYRDKWSRDKLSKFGCGTRVNNCQPNKLYLCLNTSRQYNRWWCMSVWWGYRK